ncbi:MAG: hydrogenase nickel incorporation protein HypB [Euryarchaeota archaeon]|nr:hydrogenase nickel incorporation protein HypB [Euryarchaeota archaeon]
MHRVTEVALGADLLSANKRIAEANHRLLLSRGIKSFDLVGSIGSGKTLIAEKLIDMMKAKGMRPGAIAGDVAGDDDYRRFASHGVPVVNLNTGKECHLDAHLVDHALDELPLAKMDVLFVENVGNLVCPGDFPLGTDKRVVVISVTEGDDMVRKHPLIFAMSDVVIINKIDLASAVDVDPQVLVNDAKKVNPRVPVLLTDAKHGVGLKEVMTALGL